ncbi:hypothetical protein [Acidaminococcus intestini]|uniref:hypothetical protein n=1 Tax=Acidaminococcus intestini TaxID=187327 RepID=UPI0026760757|nr:hypothetical protein [Acidaminococcus intestini]
MEKRKWKLMVLAVCSALAISGCASNESEKKLLLVNMRILNQLRLSWLILPLKVLLGSNLTAPLLKNLKK